MSINSQNGNTLLTSGSFPPARVASTGAPLNPSTGGLLIVDGVQLSAGDRVLCRDEASAVNNGIYAASTGPWVRTSDAAGNQNFFSGMAVTVALGAVNAGLTFICTCTDDPVVVGTSLITWAAQSTIATATMSAASTTSFAVSTGSKTFITQAGKAFQVGQWVIVQENIQPRQPDAGADHCLLRNIADRERDGDGRLGHPRGLDDRPDQLGGRRGLSAAGRVRQCHRPRIFPRPAMWRCLRISSGKVLADGGLLTPPAGSVSAATLLQSATAIGVNMLNGQTRRLRGIRRADDRHQDLCRR